MLAHPNLTPPRWLSLRELCASARCPASCRTSIAQRRKAHRGSRGKNAPQSTTPRFYTYVHLCQAPGIRIPEIVCRPNRGALLRNSPMPLVVGRAKKRSPPLRGEPAVRMWNWQGRQSAVQPVPCWLARGLAAYFSCGSRLRNRLIPVRRGEVRIRIVAAIIDFCAAKGPSLYPANPV